MPIDRNELRRVMGHFATGVTVITTISKEGELHGLTANAFTSVASIRHSCSSRLIKKPRAILTSKAAASLPSTSSPKIRKRSHVNSPSAAVPPKNSRAWPIISALTACLSSKAHFHILNAASTQPTMAVTIHCTWVKSSKLKLLRANLSCSFAEATARWGTEERRTAFLLT